MLCYEAPNREKIINCYWGSLFDPHCVNGLSFTSKVWPAQRETCYVRPHTDSDPLPSVAVSSHDHSVFVWLKKKKSAFVFLPVITYAMIASCKDGNGSTQKERRWMSFPLCVQQPWKKELWCILLLIIHSAFRMQLMHFNWFYETQMMNKWILLRSRVD